MPLPFLTPFVDYKILFKLALIVMSVAALFFAGYYAGSTASQDKLVEQARVSQMAIDAIRSELAVATATANQVASTNTRLLEDKVTLETKLLQKENENARKNPENSKPLVFSGTIVGLRDNTKNRCVPDTGNGVQTDSDPGTAAGIGYKATCQLDTETQRALREITRDGDEAIRQLNALIDTYNRVREVGCSVDNLPETTE